MCKNALLPKTRANWWAAKLARNVERDSSNLAALNASGWTVFVAWECEIRRDLDNLTRKLVLFLGPAGTPKGAPPRMRRTRS